jgi:hypothetical protein
MRQFVDGCFKTDPVPARLCFHLGRRSQEQRYPEPRIRSVDANDEYENEAVHLLGQWLFKAAPPPPSLTIMPDMVPGPLVTRKRKLND